MRVLFDKNVPYGTRNFLNKHRVETVDDHGWSRNSNGELLKTAEVAGFDVVLTADQNIVYQQSLVERKIVLVVFGSNIWPIVRNYEGDNQRTSGRGGSWKLYVHRNVASAQKACALNELAVIHQFLFR